MNYLDEFKKFITSHYLFTGVRLTLGTVIPCFIFYHFGILSEYIVFPLGTLLIGNIDSPGPYIRRRNSLLVGILLCFAVALITGYLSHVPLVIYAQIIIFGMFFSLIGVYGSRVNSIGSIALLVFVFAADITQSDSSILRSAAIFCAGGIWYLFLFAVLQKLRPYKLIQQLLGENFVELGKLMSIKSGYYLAAPNYNSLFTQMIQQQVILSANHEHLREILFKTRKLVTESTNKSRMLMLMFLDSVDLLEQILNSQQNYQNLHRAFDNTKLLRLIGAYIKLLGNELQQIGLAVQNGSASRPKRDLDDALSKCISAFNQVREDHMTHENLEDFMMLRQILNSVQDITDRVKKLHRATTYDSVMAEHYKPEVDLEHFTPKQEYSPRTLLDNLSLKSSHFRHALRVTIALLLGYTASLLFEFGHGHWILLTIVAILKPEFSNTKKRNLQRIAGTGIGAFIGFMVLYQIDNTTVHFVLLIFAMILAYSLTKINYLAACASITVYVLMWFNFLSPQLIASVLVDRVIDTLIGSIIAYMVAKYVFPVWEHTQIKNYMLIALQTNRAYFNHVSNIFIGQSIQIQELKLLRKNAIIALANLSDNFQRMLSEPKKRQLKMEEYHQFVATSHMLTSYIASLSSYAQSKVTQPKSDEFIPIIQHIDNQFQIAAKMINHPVAPSEMASVRDPLPQNKELLALLNTRKKEIKEWGVEDSKDMGSRKALSNLKTINGLFELIHTITIDEIKILQKIGFNKSVA